MNGVNPVRAPLERRLLAVKPALSKPSMNRSTAESVVLFIQGAGQGAHDEDRALAEALQKDLGERLRVVFPRLPGEADPDNEAWKQAIAAEARRAAATAVVAHSAGAAITADMVAQGLYGKDLPPLRAVFLLAPPFIGPGGWDFEGFHFDHAVSRQALAGMALQFYFGLADETVPPSHAELYRQVFPDAVFRSLPRCDHQFSGHMSTVAGDLRALVLGDA
jgi:predicted alpha/beta hydrolase family esterase